MTITAQQYFAASQHALDTFLSFTQSAINGAEKIAQLNFESTRKAVEDFEANKDLFAAKDVQELVNLQRNLARPNIEKAVAYSRSLYDIANETKAELIQISENRRNEYQQAIENVLSSTAKNAPGGADVAVAAMKSAINATNQMIESVSKANRRADSIAEANLNAVSNATAKAAKTVPAATSRKKSV